MRTKLIIATGILLASPLAAQEDVALRAGIAISSIVGNGGDPIIAPAVGVDVGVPLGAGLPLRPGVSYAATGTKTRYYAGGLERTGRRSIDYLQASSLVARPVVGSDRVSLGVRAGPWFAVKVACDASGTFGPGLCEGSDPGAEAVDYGLAGGLGLNYGIADGLLIGFDALYSYGLKDVIDYPPPGIGLTVEGKEYTRLLSLQVGVVLKMK